MGKPPGLIEEFESPEIDRDKELAEHGAHPRAVKGIYIAIAVSLVILFILVMVGLHIPAGG